VTLGRIEKYMQQNYKFIALSAVPLNSLHSSLSCATTRLIWQNSERERERTRAPNSEPATFATYHIAQKRWVRSEPRLGPFKDVTVTGDVWEGLELPRPRSAHQVVYDDINKVFYMQVLFFRPLLAKH